LKKKKGKTRNIAGARHVSRTMFILGRGLIMLFVEHGERDGDTVTQMTHYYSTLCEPINLKPLL
jgi:uncharacterized membrane protein